MDVSRLVVSAVRLAALRRLAPRGARTQAGARLGPSGGRPRRPWRSTRRDPGVASAEGWPWREGRVLGSLGAGCRQGRVTAFNPSGGWGGEGELSSTEPREGLCERRGFCWETAGWGSCDGAARGWDLRRTCAEGRRAGARLRCLRRGGREADTSGSAVPASVDLMMELVCRRPLRVLLCREFV